MRLRRSAVLAATAVLSATIATTPGAAGSTTGGDSPPRVMLVLDSSGSMKEQVPGGSTKIAAAKSALHDVIAHMPGDTEVGLRVFGAKVFRASDPGACTDSEAVVPLGTGNRDALGSAVDSYKPYGETPIPAALKGAAHDLGDRGTRSMVLVTDGRSTCGDPCKVAADLAQGGVDLHIDVVGLAVDARTRTQLQCIAKAGNGNYYDAANAGDISSSIVRVAERAAKPFRILGTPIEGGSEQIPARVAPGDYVDTIGKEAKYYAFTRTVAGSTIRAAAYTQGESATSQDVALTLQAPDGTRCDYGQDLRSLDWSDVLGAEVASDRNDSCAAAGTYLLELERTTQASEPVRVGLRIREEPGVTDPGFVTTAGPTVAAPTPSTATKKVDGEASFETAHEIGDGSWKSDIVPGEVLLYRVHLDFGQSLRVATRFPALTKAQYVRLGDSVVGGAIGLYDPLRGHATAPSAADWSGAVGTTLTGEPQATTLFTATPAISRADKTSQLSGADFATAGDYYLSVAVKATARTVDLPFVIDVRVDGPPAEGPTYAGGTKWSVDGAPATRHPRARGSAASNSSGGGAGLPLFGGAALLAALAAGGFVLLRRRTGSD